MKNFSKVAVGLLASTSILVAGCQTVPGNLNGFSADPMAKVVLVSSKRPYLLPVEYALGEHAANHCGQPIDRQLSSPVITMGVSGAAYAGAYAAAGAGQAVEYGTDPVTGAAVGGMWGAAGGIVNGAISDSYNRSTITGMCSENTLRDWQQGNAPEDIKAKFPNMASDLAGLHAYPSTVATRNQTGHPAPGLVTTGEQVGTRR